MARDASGRTRAERKAARLADRAKSESAGEPRSGRRELGRYKSSTDSEVLVSRGQRAGTFLVEIGPAGFGLTHEQAWDLARSLLQGLQHAHLGRIEAEPEEDEDEAEEGGDE